MAKSGLSITREGSGHAMSLLRVRLLCLSCDRSRVVLTADEDVVSRVTDCLETKDKSFQLIPDPHFSLFRGNCVIRHHHIDLVVQSMREKLSKLHPFNVLLKLIRTLQNEDCSRSFVCVCCEGGSSNIRLQRVLDTVKECLKDFTDVKDYDDEFIPHVSLLWFLEKDGLVDSASEKLVQEFGECPLLIRVTRVNLKIGNRSYSIDMKNT